MKKKFLIMAATLGLGIAAAGCGSAASGTSTTASTTTAVTTEATTAATTEAATTQAATTAAASTTAAAASVTTITEAEAKSASVKHAGFAESDVTFTKVEQDLDGTVKKFEIEFVNGDKEYSYEINMETGEIIKSEVENVND